MQSLWNRSLYFSLLNFFLILPWFGLLAVMQFGGQHPGGIGVPAVGMAFPGYVAQPQLGLGNSEMTWYGNPFIVNCSFFCGSPCFSLTHVLRGDSFGNPLISG